MRETPTGHQQEGADVLTERDRIKDVRSGVRRPYGAGVEWRVSFIEVSGRRTALLSVVRDVTEVDDHGIGICTEDLPHGFERFRRGTNATNRVAGSGVGLASVCEVVEATRWKG